MYLVLLFKCVTPVYTGMYPYSNLRVRVRKMRGYTGVYTFIHKTISRGTFFVGPNEKLIMLASNSKKFNTK